MDRPSQVYSNGFTRVAGLVRDLDDEGLATIVTACPEWSVRDLVAHLTGVASDSLAANVAEMGQSGWTQAQVDRRRDDSVAEVLAEWSGITEQLEAALDDLHPALSSALIGDLITHEHDLRGTLRDSEQRDNDGVVIAASFYARNFGKRLKDAGLPTLIVDTGRDRWTAGREEPAGTVRAPLFEMLRGLTGRRTLDEVKGFDWSVAPDPYLPLFSMYPVTPKSLNE